jgi:hypothetical protein
MSDASRRDALKLSAAAGFAALGTALLQNNSAFGQVAAGAQNEPTFDAVNQLMEKAAGTDLQATMASAKAAAGDVPGSWRELICPYYRALRPVLVAISALPFIPANWRTVINSFVTIMDQVCPN